MKDKILKQVEEAFKNSDYDAPAYKNYFARLTVEMKLPNFNKRDVIEEFNRRVFVLRSEYFELSRSLNVVLAELSQTCAEDFNHARFGFQKDELHPEDIVFEKSAVYLREFLRKYEMSLDQGAIAIINKMIAIADKVRNLEF